MTDENCKMNENICSALACDLQASLFLTTAENVTFRAV